MHKITENALAIFVNFAFTANQLLAQLPPETFDATEWVPYQAVGQGPQPGWQLAAGNAVVSEAGEGFNGGQALRLPVNSVERTKITRAVNWDVNEKTAFIDFRLKPAADPTGSYSSFSVNGTQLAFQVPAGATHGESGF